MKNTTASSLIGIIFFAASAAHGQIQYTTDANTVALYHFNETSGTTAFDSSGSSRNATYGSLVQIAQPSMPGMGTSMQPGNTLSGGRTSYVDTSVANGQDSVLYTMASSSFTLEAWIKFDDLNFTSTSMIMTVQPFQTTAFDYRLGVFGSSSGSNAYGLTFGTSAINNMAFTIGGLSWTVDQWYHIAVTVENTGAGPNDTTIKIYRNVVGDSTTPAPIATVTGRPDLVLNTASTAQRDLEIGNYYGANGANYFHGQIDEVRISNVARTEFQTLALVPEPSTAVLAGAACVTFLFGSARRRRTRN